MAEILTTKEMARYLKMHEITVCKYAGLGVIPAIRIGRVWRFDKAEIDRWIEAGLPAPKQKEAQAAKTKKAKKR